MDFEYGNISEAKFIYEVTKVEGDPTALDMVVIREDGSLVKVRVFPMRHIKAGDENGDSRNT